MILMQHSNFYIVSCMVICRSTVTIKLSAVEILRAIHLVDQFNLSHL